jgi:hypothetical protein
MLPARNDTRRTQEGEGDRFTVTTRARIPRTRALNLLTTHQRTKVCAVICYFVPLLIIWISTAGRDSRPTASVHDAYVV